jgi:hypothetical protein
MTNDWAEHSSDSAPHVDKTPWSAYYKYHRLTLQSLTSSTIFGAIERHKRCAGPMKLSIIVLL